jgi:hypothetical protein
MKQPSGAFNKRHERLRTNIMLRPDGYVKVIDFGLAKFTNGIAFGDGKNGSIGGFAEAEH